MKGLAILQELMHKCMEGQGMYEQECAIRKKIYYPQIINSPSSTSEKCLGTDQFLKQIIFLKGVDENLVFSVIFTVLSVKCAK